MPNKIIIIGIDGFDPSLLIKWKDALPNCGKLFGARSEAVMESTFPADSICAWTSIYTGKNPAEHGLIESIDYLASKKLQNSEDRADNFRGKTFWDEAGDKGKKVCLINPFIAYPAWSVNGVMVSGPVFEGGDISVYPDDLLKRYNFPPLGGIVDYPDEKDLAGFLEKTKYNTEQLAEAGFRMYKDTGPDLFFIAFLTLDRIKHFFWRFTDEEDVYYPGDNPFKNVVKDFYLLFDRIVGSYMESMDKDTTLLVISDHGHARRCTKSLNLNEILRKKGYLATSGSGITAEIKKLMEKTKVFTLTTMSRYGLQDWIFKVAKFVPNRKALKKSTYLIDKEGSSVVLSNLCGANPEGGIDVKAGTKEEYEKLRGEIIEELMDLNGAIGGEIVKWAKRREQVYSGEYEKRLPDVLFELDEDYGVGMDMFTPPVTPNYTHKKVSGGHRSEAVLLVHGSNESIRNLKRPESVIGIKDFILEIIGA